MDTADIVIIGGGVIGLTTGYLLAQEGADVVVLDKGDLGHEASWAGAGIVPPGNPESARTPFDRLRALSVSMFPRLSAELREKTAIDNGYIRCGGLEFPDTDHPTADEEWRGEGVVCRPIADDELACVEPSVATGLGPTWSLPDMAQVRNPRHLQALIAGCADKVRLRPGFAALRLLTSGTRVVGVQTALGQWSCGQVLLAAGAWTDALLEPLGWRPGIQPVRGQIALLRGSTALFRRVLMSGPRYLVPRPDGRVLVGSTEEWVGFDKRTTAAALHDLLALAFRLVPALRAASLERCWAGLRPGSPDGLPLLGPVPGWQQLFIAAGHFRAGIQLSPGTAVVMKQLLLGQSPAIDLAAFRPDRVQCQC
jgi:glycine oxidase